MNLKILLHDFLEITTPKVIQRCAIPFFKSETFFFCKSLENYNFWHMFKSLYSRQLWVPFVLKKMQGLKGGGRQEFWRQHFISSLELRWSIYILIIYEWKNFGKNAQCEAKCCGLKVTLTIFWWFQVTPSQVPSVSAKPVVPVVPVTRYFPH